MGSMLAGYPPTRFCTGEDGLLLLLPLLPFRGGAKVLDDPVPIEAEEVVKGREGRESDESPASTEKRPEGVRRDVGLLLAVVVAVRRGRELRLSRRAPLSDKDDDDLSPKPEVVGGRSRRDEKDTLRGRKEDALFDDGEICQT